MEIPLDKELEDNNIFKYLDKYDNTVSKHHYTSIFRATEKTVNLNNILNNLENNNNDLIIIIISWAI